MPSTEALDAQGMLNTGEDLVTTDPCIVNKTRPSGHVTAVPTIGETGDIAHCTVTESWEQDLTDRWVGTINGEARTAALPKGS